MSGKTIIRRRNKRTIKVFMVSEATHLVTLKSKKGLTEKEYILKFMALLEKKRNQKVLDENNNEIEQNFTFIMSNNGTFIMIDKIESFKILDED